MCECTFCRIIDDALPSYKIYEDEGYLAFLDINPVNPGHTLLIPKSHEDYIFDLSENELGKLFARAKHIAEPLRQATQSKRIGIIVEGFAVPHIHVHLIPIFTGHDLEPQRANTATSNELADMADNISAVMQENPFREMNSVEYSSIDFKAV